MADQLRFDCLSCYGNLPVRTPNLDALSRESIVFDHAYCATPLCMPTRTCIGTGKWPHTTRAIINSNARYPMEEPWGMLGSEHATFYEALAQAGYDIRHVGVQHIKSLPPLAQRVPQATLLSTEHHDAHMKQRGMSGNYHDFPTHAGREPTVPVLDFDNGRMIVKSNWQAPTYVTPFPYPAEHFKDFYFADQMERQIATADPTRPTLLVFQGWAPHPPLFSPEPYFSMYDPASIELPENVGQWYPGMPPTLLLGTGAMRGCQIAREDWRRVWAAYFGLVTLFDDCLGRVIGALKAKGIWDDALVIFTVDHGEANGSHRQYEKMTLYEESAHIPLMVRPPGGGGAGSRRPQMVGHVDLAPTLCDYGGAAPLPGAWGQSLRPVVNDAAAPWRDATFAEFNGDQGRAFPSRGIITSRYKYIHHFFAGDELYDLHNDPQETRSLSADPQHAGIVADLKQRLMQWMRQTNDVLDLQRDEHFFPSQWATISRGSLGA
jgi:arylsulfatase A-like enzyme